MRVGITVAKPELYPRGMRVTLDIEGKIHPYCAAQRNGHGLVIGHQGRTVVVQLEVPRG